MGKPTTEFYRQLRSDLGQGPFAVNAARRLKAGLQDKIETIRRQLGVDGYCIQHDNQSIMFQFYVHPPVEYADRFKKQWGPPKVGKAKGETVYRWDLRGLGLALYLPDDYRKAARIQMYNRDEQFAGASTIVKEGYTEKQGAEELARLTAYLKEYPGLCESLGVKGEMHFYKFRGSKYGGYDIVCMVNEVAVGSVHLSPRRLELEDGAKLSELQCVQPSSFISLPYRGKGIVFGMYQWAISQYNLVADERQTRASFNLWKRLAKMYPALVISQVHKYKPIYKIDPEAKPTLKTTLMLIKRHT